MSRDREKMILKDWSYWLMLIGLSIGAPIVCYHSFVEVSGWILAGDQSAFRVSADQWLISLGWLIALIGGASFNIHIQKNRKYVEQKRAELEQEDE